ncbi:hypothetical protein L3Q82_012018, partial [Scortum barcoo]
NPLNQLKDLVELKDQLEDIQRRVEDEIQAGVPPVRLTKPLICSGRQSSGFSFPEGFSGRVRRCKAALFSGDGRCSSVGTCTGIYAAQNYAVPNIENTVKDYIRNLRGK